MQHLSENMHCSQQDQHLGVSILLLLLLLLLAVLLFFLAHRQTISIVASDLLLFFSARLLARSFTAIVPYFPTGTMEREEIEGRVATAKVFDEEYQTILFFLSDCRIACCQFFE